MQFDDAVKKRNVAHLESAARNGGQAIAAGGRCVRSRSLF
jgi:hypothetical protein